MSPVLELHVALDLLCRPVCVCMGHTTRSSKESKYHCT